MYGVLMETTLVSSLDMVINAMVVVVLFYKYRVFVEMV